MTELPDLGVGIVYWPGIDHLVQAVGGAIDVIEVEPQPFWFAPKARGDRFRIDERALDHLRRLPQPKVVHGVGFPIGGTAVPQGFHLEPFAESIAALHAAWASEHLSFNRVRRGGDDVDLGFLLPPVQSAEGIAMAASNIREVKAHLSVPFAFETGVSYLQPTMSEFPDGAYFAAVAEAADCGILLDLHNVWANERNGRQTVLELVDELPLDRIWELHVAGGQLLDGLWVDAHSGLAPQPVLDLARAIAPRLPNLKAIVFEIMPEYATEYALTSEDLLHQMRKLREIWETRGTRVTTASAAPPARPPHPTADSPPSPLAWERAFDDALFGIAATGDLAERLALDPGIGVLRRLIGSVRAGKVASSLRLTTRLLLLALGEEAVDAVFQDFWRSVPSELAASDEAQRFATFLDQHPPTGVPFLTEVISFELAAHQVLIEGRPQVLRSCYDLNPVVDALRKGMLPRPAPSGEYEITILAPVDVAPTR